MLDENMSEIPNAADDLPRPPAGRRSATRPAGPPTEEETSTAAVDKAPVAEKGEPDEEPVAKTRATRARRTTTRKKAEVAPEPEAAPVEAEQPARPRRRLVARRTSTEKVQESTTLAGEAPQDADADAPAAEPTTRRRTTRAKKATPPAEGLDLESVLTAVETAAAGGPRKTTRKRAVDLLGDEVPTDDAGEVDAGLALASLAASIAARAESEDESEEKPKRRATRKREATEKKPKKSKKTDKTDTGPEESADSVPDESPQEATPAESEASPAEVRSGGQDDPAEAAASDNGEEDGSGGTRRRRRRGGRRRRRSHSQGDDTGQSADGESEDDDEGSEESDSEAENGAESAQTSEGGSRRRRRRRRGSSSEVEDGELAVQVREPKALADEISGIEGSTRLEAKKQRRREGRAAGRHRSPILSEAEFLARRESVERVMLIRERADYSQVAVMEDGVLVEHYVDRSTSTSLIGNVYLGRVQNVLPSMEAVFIDIGRARNAVLYAGEVDWDAFEVSADERKVEQVFKSGQSVIVQVSKDPVGAKGARLTGHVSLPGRYVVYSPGGHLSGISRKLPSQERRRLKSILDEVVDDHESVIVRTAAEGASEEELINDVERLKALWDGVEKKAKSSTAPQVLYAEPDLTLRIVRDTFTEDFDQLVVAGTGAADDAWTRISEYISRVAPNLVERLVKWEEAGDPFARFRIDEQISKALERKVFLPSGGSLVIDRTEAMTVVDVNTGKFTGSGGNLEETITKNNLEAAEEIVRQLRLRDLGGIIVIDFIDMVLPSNRELLVRRLVECLGRDRTRHQVSEVTSLGLVQMTRKRIGTGLAEAFTEECSCCGGRGYTRFDDPVESQAPADGGERRQKSDAKRGRRKDSAGESRDVPKAAQVHASDEARKAASQVAAASKHLSEKQPDQAAASADDSGTGAADAGGGEPAI